MLEIIFNPRRKKCSKIDVSVASYLQNERIEIVAVFLLQFMVYSSISEIILCNWRVGFLKIVFYYDTIYFELYLIKIIYISMVLFIC